MQTVHGAIGHNCLSIWSPLSSPTDEKSGRLGSRIKPMRQVYESDRAVRIEEDLLCDQTRVSLSIRSPLG
jgi:hypothetical protein